MVLSDVARTGRGFTDTSLDSVSLSFTQTFDIPFTVAWPAGILPETPAGVTLTTPQQQYRFFSTSSQ
jgi:hypothetical protein